MLRKLFASAAIGAAAALSFALFSSLFDSSTPRGQAQAPTVKRGTPRPLTAVRAPSVVLNGLISQAKRAEVADLATAGAAGDLAFGRSIVIGRSDSGAPEAAIIDTDGHSSFMTPAQIFDHSPLAVFSSQAGRRRQCARQPSRCSYVPKSPESLSKMTRARPTMLQ
jgi:hypothetical protein